MGSPKTGARKRTIALAFFIALSLLPVIAAGGAVKVVRQEIEKAVMCPCEEKCGKVLANCVCDYSDGFRREIDRMIARGMSRQEILAALVKRYGPTVLAAPGTSNWLDLSAWIFPFIALAAGAFLVARLVRRWASPPPASPPTGPSGPSDAGSPSNSAYERRLQEELSRLEP